MGIRNWELGIGTATVSQYDPAFAVSTHQPVALTASRSRVILPDW